MSHAIFEKLLNIIEPFITKTHVVRTPIPARTRLQVTLRYLSSGDSMVSISYAFRIAHNTVSLIINETCESIWNSLKHRVFLQPSSNNWEKVAEDFERICNFTHCIGAPDGKHVVIQAPPNSGSKYYNYKGQHSIVLLAISDAHCCFSMVDIGGEGRQCDSTIFQNSEFGKRFGNGSLNLPAAKNIANTNVTLPYVLVADEAFQLTPYMMRPYPRKDLGIRKKVFNYRLSRARRTVECAFGLLAARWRVYGKPIIASVSTTRNIIKATTAIHNFVMISERESIRMLPQYSRYTAQDRAIISDGLRNISRSVSSNSVQAVKIRDDFTDFFNNIGAMPWQWKKVLNNDF
ncbi:PREDICTED: putative nuclease HARBI1 [Cyphomyrmex costatus]|nr:PREDICTED: putative nuclease HARBI1 [Cyphomyrmex costatus]